jgi:hypothetical protein
MPAKSNNVLLRLYGTLQHWFDKTCKRTTLEFGRADEIIEYGHRLCAELFKAK